MRSHSSRTRAAAVLAAAAALVVSGCTAEKKDDPASTASGAPVAPPAPRVAPGVTDTSIKLGITYPDLSAVKQFLKIDHGDYEATYNALIKKINDAGGINGRKIEPVFGAINVASPAAAQETCVKLTQDAKVFAAIGTFNANEPMCYVQTNKTAVVGGSLGDKNYAAAQAPWFSDIDGDAVVDAVKVLAANNALAGKKVAVVGPVNEQAAVNDLVLPTLRDFGVTPVETGIMDASMRDAAAVSQQLGVFIQKFQAAGADTIVVVGGMGGEFPKQLEKTSYRPRLLFTDVTRAEIYTGDQAQHDFSTLTNATAAGTKVDWNDPALRECIATVEAAIPDLKGKLTVDPATLPAGTPSPQTSMQTACRNLTLFKAIADKAGRDLNYETFQNAGFTLGPLQIPSLSDKADYTRETPHGAVPPRLFTYDPAAKKFRTT
ncbi:ABC transporter substrate-binding protein [Yinghuangia sp. YIM S10712]|uniref:ABC transporter substrate-binding protein n=1 Tax=Yinghuangia sp. YIM S10712 TaxID=3436930 RepID=UPI003F53D0CB